MIGLTKGVYILIFSLVIFVLNDVCLKEDGLLSLPLQEVKLLYPMLRQELDLNNSPFGLLL